MAYFQYNSKQIYYTKVGEGKPVIFLHGNTASSKMFDLLLPLYQEHFAVILIDFLGNGKSDRVEKFPDNMWLDEGMQTIALIEHLGNEKMDLVGTSGGAIAAVNAVLERPDLINKVVADSMATSFDGMVGEFVEQREVSKSDAGSIEFYSYCQGEDWESIVDMDTEAILRFVELKLPLFSKTFGGLKNPLLLMGSKGDSMLTNISAEYSIIKKQAQNCSTHIFETGDHPAIATNAEQAARVIINYLNA